MRVNDGAAAIARPPIITDLLLTMRSISCGDIPQDKYAGDCQPGEAAQGPLHWLVSASSGRPLLALLDDALGGASDQLLQMIELGVERADALGDRADLDDHVGDLGLRHQRRHLVPAIPARARVVA